MWARGGDISDAGGFDKNADTDGGSPTKKPEVRRVQNVVPVFISHITECTSEDFTIQGTSVQMVDVLGVVRNFDVQSTKATCLIEDQTGSIEAILWLETDGNTVSTLPPVQENCYARVFGSVRTQGGSKMIMILKIIPIDDVNVITHHRLQIIYAKLAMQGRAGVPTIQMPSTSNNGSISYADISESQSNPHGLTPLQAKILSIMNKVSESVSGVRGVSRDEILAHFEPGKARDVTAALNFLLDEGHTYTTCDNDHFQATHSF